MDTDLRPSGVDRLGDMSWGTHFCLFYETKEDLLDFFIPFFKAGLEHHEFCLCVASEPLIAEEAQRAMGKAFPDFERYLAEGQIEITPHTDWYLKEGHFDEQRVLQVWIDKLDQALAKGFSGVRFAANILLEKSGWVSFSQYEGKLEETLRDLRIEGLCAYDLNRYSAANVLDVIRHHQFALARRAGTWEPLEGAGLERAHEQVLKLNAELEPRVMERTAQLTAINEQLNREIGERQRSEETLRASEARLQAAIDAANIGLWDWDLVSGQIIWLGHHDKLFGFAPGEFDGTYASFEKRVHPDDLAELKRVVQIARDERAEFVHEYRIIWPDGSLHWIAGRGRFIYSETGEPVRMCGGVRDITERKRMEQALRESETKLKEAQQLANIGYWERDLIADRITWSEETGRIFGLQSLEGTLSQAKFQEMIHPDDRQLQRQAVSEALQGSRPYDVEFRIVRPDGNLRFVHVRDEIIYDKSGRPIRMFGAVQDITERKQAEEELRQYAARMEMLAGISQALATVGLDVQTVLETIVRHIAEVIGDGCVLSLLSSDEQWLKPMAFHHPKPEARALVSSVSSITPIPASREWVAHILRTGEPLLIPLVTPEQSRQNIFPEFLPLLEQVGFHSTLIVPLRAEGRVIGTLSLTRDQPRSPYTPNDQVLLQALADRAALTIQNARLFEQVQGAHERLQALSRRLLQVQEAERHHIARELHDEVGQVLTGLKFLLETTMPLAAESIQARLAKALRLADELTMRLQELSLNLRPPMLDELGLLPTLAWHFKRYTDQTNIQVDFKYMGPERRLGPEIETAVYRIVQEALTNVARHAQVGEVTVQVWVEPNSLRLQIEDAGVGFDLEAALAARASSGLSGMYERAALLGGQLTVVAAPGAGASLIAEFPLGDPVGERAEQP